MMGARDLLDRAIDRSGTGRLALNGNTNRLRILCYHGIWAAGAPHFGNKLFMSAEKFEARLALIRALGLNVLPMREAIRALFDRTLPPRAAVITIDDGWATTFSHMLPALERYGYPATIYVQTERIEVGAPVADVALSYALQNCTADEISLEGLSASAKETSQAGSLRDRESRQQAFAAIEQVLARTPIDTHRSLLRELYSRLDLDTWLLAKKGPFDLCSEDDLVEARRKGFEIALHTHTHSLGDFSAHAVTSEITRNRASLSRMLDRPPESFRHFCWPSGDYTPQAIDHLRATGVDLATTCDLDLATAKSDPLALPRLLDGQLTSDEAFLVGVSGLQRWIDRLGSLVRGARSAAAET
jgi:peptidoglycan/xylan/chitin deacetylase (PgdA/CDA1 family)